MLAIEVTGWIMVLYSFLQPQAQPLRADAPVAHEHAAPFVRLQPFDERFFTPKAGE